MWDTGISSGLWSATSIIYMVFALLLGTGLLIFVERTLYLHRGQIRAQDFLTGIRNLVTKGRRVEALALCEETPGPVARVIRAGLLQAGQPAERMVAAMRAAGLVELPFLERRLGSLSLMAVLAPMLGLLGTVLGLTNAYLTQQQTGAYGSWNLVTGGIADALATTAVGIVVSVVLTLMHHFLHGRLRAVLHDMEWSANELFLLDTGAAAEAADGELAKREPQPESAALR